MCNGTVHKKCFRSELGCEKCCTENFAGYNVTHYELFDDYSPLNNIFYNPYNSTHLTNQIGEALDDAEQNGIWSETSEFLLKCKYKQLKDFGASNDGELQILSLNIRSLKKNISNIRENIEQYHKFDVLCFNETNCIFDKLPNGMDDIRLEGFHDPIVKSSFRASGKGGGLVSFINKRVCESHDIQEFFPNPDPANGCGEFQFIKLHNCIGTNRTLIIGNVYRSPAKRNCEPFNNLLESIVQNLNRHARKQIYIAGDFNQDLIQHDNNTQTQTLIDSMTKLSFVQIVSRPTRITETSATIIDHVYTNNIENTLSCNIATLDISDHLATVTKISLGNSKIKINRRAKVEKSEYRTFNDANDYKFKELIHGETWDNVINTHDAQSQYDTFCETYTTHYNTAYPLKSQHKRRKHERANPQPWILPWLEDACARKNNMYHTFVKHPTSKNRKAYIKMKKFVEKHKEKAKKHYYSKYFEKYSESSKMQWKMLNNLLGRKQKHCDSIKLLDSDGKLISSMTISLA